MEVRYALLVVDDTDPAPVQPDAAIVLAKRRDVILGKATVRPSLRTVSGPLGDAKGEPRVIQVLLALADARGAVLTREDLLQQCWNGRIVGDDAINRAVAEVRRISSAVGGEFEVETVPRVGYRLVGIDWDNQSPPAIGDLAKNRLSRRRVLLGGAAALGLSSLAGFAILHRQRDERIDALVSRGQSLQWSGRKSDVAKAEQLFREAIAGDPHRADAWGWLSTVLKDQGEARDAAQKAIQLDPREPNGRTVLALQRRDLDSWTQFEDALLGVLADSPDNALALNELTFFYQGMGRCRDSWSANERAIKVEPFNPTPLHRKAIKHWIFGRIGDADRTADQALRLWPSVPNVWNARMIIFAFTGRADAGLALLDDEAVRPQNLKPPSISSWRAALHAIGTHSSRDISFALDTFVQMGPLAPGIAANAIMTASYLGEVDAAYNFAKGLLESQGGLVQRSRGPGVRDAYSGSSWGRTQFVFIPAMNAFRSDARFPELCRGTGHVAYWRSRGIWPDDFVRGAIDPARLA